MEMGHHSQMSVVLVVCIYGSQNTNKRKRLKQQKGGAWKVNLPIFSNISCVSTQLTFCSQTLGFSAIMEVCTYPLMEYAGLS